MIKGQMYFIDAEDFASRIASDFQALDKDYSYPSYTDVERLVLEALKKTQD